MMPLTSEDECVCMAVICNSDCHRIPVHWQLSGLSTHRAQSRPQSFGRFLREVPQEKCARSVELRESGKKPPAVSRPHGE